MHRLLLCLLLIPLLAGVVRAGEIDQVPVLCFHDVRDTGAPLTELTVSSDHLLAQFSWLRGAGYTPVSIDEILAARRGDHPLPNKAVLLTFDDGYTSFYTRVFPLLKLFNFPAVLSLVGSWMETSPGEMISYGDKRLPRKAFISWSQVREMIDSGVVEIASHTYNLHRGVAGNPQGNLQPAAATRIYDPGTGRYEEEGAYRQRIASDLRQSLDLIEERTGRRPRVITWPFGRPAPLGSELASEIGLEIELLLERQHRGETPLLNFSRHLVPPGSTLATFAGLLRPPAYEWSRRAVRISLDTIYDADPDRREKMLGELLERTINLGVSTVFLEAYHDADNDGIAEALYFPNSELPMRADLFNRTAWQLMTRSGVEVHAALPLRGSKVRLETIYTGLARLAHFQGLLFDPGIGLAGDDSDTLEANQKELASKARAFRPRLQSLELLSGIKEHHASSSDWTVRLLDEGIYMEPHRIAKLAETLEDTLQGLDRTVFFVDLESPPADRQAAGELFALLRRLQASGARHLGYGPDDPSCDAPPLKTIAPAISQREYPDEL